MILLLLLILAVTLVQAQTTSGAKSAKAEPAVPANLSYEIRHQLLELPFYSEFDFISFTLEGRKVTLNGQVIRRTLKKDAEAAIKSIDGVGAVVNNIEVLPASPSDDELRRDVYRAIYEDSTLARYATQPVPPIHVIVKSGSVALEGWVTAESDKSLAAARARSVTNATGVKNNLVVHAGESAAK